MGYKLNIRNITDTAWINILQATNIELVDSNSKFTATEVESALEELYDNKAPRIETTSAPTTADDNYQTGAIWVNTVTDKVFICVDNTASNAIWINLESLQSNTYETTATSGQTVFDLPWTYTFGQVAVYIDGIRQMSDAYTETDNDTITMSEGLDEGTYVLIESK